MKLTSDLPIVWQVIVAHLLLLISAIVLLAHCPPVVTHLNENIFLVFLFQELFFVIWSLTVCLATVTLSMNSRRQKLHGFGLKECL